MIKNDMDCELQAACAVDKAEVKNQGHQKTAMVYTTNHALDIYSIISLLEIA